MPPQASYQPRQESAGTSPLTLLNTKHVFQPGWFPASRTTPCRYSSSIRATESKDLN